MTEETIPQPRPEDRALAEAWAVIFDDVHRAVSEAQAEASQAELWLTMGLVASLYRLYPQLMTQVWAQMERGGFPFFLESMVPKIAAELTEALEKATRVPPSEV